jgi:hypothetical protein
MAMVRQLMSIVVACVLAALGCAVAAAEADGKPPRTYALVAAFGNQMSFVQAKYQTGTHLDPYVRNSIALNGQSLNATILRAIDDTIAQQMPQSRRVYLALDPSVTSGLSPDRRDAAASKAALDAVRQMPQRKDWDEILIVTPAYVASEFNGLAPRTAGAGVLVQAVEGTTLISPRRDNIQLNAETSGNPPEAVVAPDGFAHASRTYLAVHYYARLRRYDAQTLELISEESRFDSVKLHDPAAESTYLLRSIPADVLAQRLTTVVQESTAAAVRRAMGMVTVGPLREAGEPAAR